MKTMGWPTSTDKGASTTNDGASNAETDVGYQPVASSGIARMPIRSRCQGEHVLPWQGSHLNTSVQRCRAQVTPRDDSRARKVVSGNLFRWLAIGLAPNASQPLQSAARGDQGVGGEGDGRAAGGHRHVVRRFPRA